MSSSVNLSDDGNGGGEDSNSGAAAEPNKFSCEICKRTVVLEQSDSSPEPSCPHCRNNQGSLNEQEPEEEVQESSSSSSSTAIINPLSPGIFDAAFRHFRSTDPSPDPFNPFLFLQRYLRRLYGDGVRVIDAEIVIEDDGQGLETPLGQLHYQHFLQLIQQISVEEEDDLPRPTPASKSAVEELPAIAASEELSNVCVVCIEEFVKGEELRELPCKHIYHKDCILTWLKQRNTCPECRYELAKEDDESNVELYIVNSVDFTMWLDISLPQEEDDHHDLAPENENPNGSCSPLGLHEGTFTSVLINGSNLACSFNPVVLAAQKALRATKELPDENLITYPKSQKKRPT
ncbi:43kDa postsynaptic protein [Parasponia andersonii]|uniref:RING-type E3 ubiquitin transferase n=1 Tax=Parasponia andersonii TaxID=3476 RepID=A0A2P5D4I7_PARAD|nr:43kDa postsynaptic protein [Parasponia andersonii]